MYKVVIIDDEDIIVEGLRKVVDWNKYNCEVVGTAIDALTGATVIREHNPDIVFTDIKMPNMDGLTMLAGLKCEHPRMQITVLTGYRDFEYAKRAIKIGVTRFLLKPSKMSELEEALQAMTENLLQRQNTVPAPQEDMIEEKNSNSGSFILNSALKYIENHYCEKLTLTALAEKIYVSQWYLSKLLNKYTDKSFSDLLNQTRINQSKKLLAEPSLKIHEISDMVGFGDVTHFSKIFKKFEGVSPNEFRNHL